MLSLYRVSAALVLTSMLIGCGTTASPLAPSKLAATQTAFAGTADDAKAQRLVNGYKAVQGYAPAGQTERIHLMRQMAQLDSDRASNFLLAELVRLEKLSPEVQTTLEAPLVAALELMAKLDEQRDAGASRAGSQMNQVEAAAKRRRFNIWDGLNKYFKPKKKKAGGGGGTPPAPPAPPADGPADAPPAPPAPVL